MKRIYTTAFMFLLCAVLLVCGCTQKEAETNDNQEPAAPAEQTASILYAELKETNSWEENGNTVRQYMLRIENQSEADISDWQVTLQAEEKAEIRDCWNAQPDKTEGKSFVFTAMDYNNVLTPHQKYQDAGFIVKGELSLTKIEAKQNGDIVTVLPTEMNRQTVTHTPIEVTPAKTENIVGPLSLEGNQIVDSSGNVIQLQGISLHGLAWFPQYVNKDTFQTLRDEWGVNLIRLPLYTAEYNGYCNGGDQEELKKLIDDGVRYCSELGMYVIIDWHILSDNDPRMNEEEAARFFAEMAIRYRDFDNVIFEICNEPQNSSWDEVIKPYAERILKVIRDNDNDALVIVGTNTWSQDIDQVIGSQIDDDRVLYAFHFYVSTHKEDLRNRLQKAYDCGVPVFVSECGVSEASGSGRIDYDSADAWFSLLYQDHIGFCVWNLSNKDETSALLSADCEKLSGWQEEELSESGRWVHSLLAKEKRE